LPHISNNALSPTPIVHLKATQGFQYIYSDSQSIHNPPLQKIIGGWLFGRGTALILGSRLKNFEVSEKGGSGGGYQNQNANIAGWDSKAATPVQMLVKFQNRGNITASVAIVRSAPHRDQRIVEHVPGRRRGEEGNLHEGEAQTYSPPSQADVHGR
jgi:hypothetical protein